MIKYKVQIDSPTIVLSVMNRERTFKKNEIVEENLYTNMYPQYFKKIGEVQKLTTFLAKPVFIKDPIEDFIEREKARKNIYNNTKKEKLPEKVDFEEIVKDKEKKLDNIEELDEISIMEEE